MSKGPIGQKLPGDEIGAAIMVARIAMGEIEDGEPSASEAGGAASKKGG